MKRWITGILIFIVLVLAIGMSVPLLFKQKLNNAIVENISAYLGGKVEIQELDLSLFKHFPKLNVEMRGVEIKGAESFQNDTLLFVPNVRTVLPLASLFSPSDMYAGQIELDDAQFKLKTDVNGKSNWDFKPYPDSKNSAEPKSTNAINKGFFAGQLKVNNASFEYNDLQNSVLVRSDDIRIDYREDNISHDSTLNVNAAFHNFDIKKDGISYLQDVSIRFEGEVVANSGKKAWRLGDNTLLINELPLFLAGEFSEINDTLQTQLTISAEEVDLAHLLKLFPATKNTFLTKMNALGNVLVEGKVEGYFVGNTFPGLQLGAEIDRASLQYTGMSGSIDDLTAKIELTKPQGKLDSLRLEISDAHAEVGGDKLDLVFGIAHPFSDPYFSGAFRGKIDLAKWKEVVPLNNTQLSGVINADVAVNGLYSAILEEEYSKVVSNGTLELTQLVYNSPQLTQQIVVPAGKLEMRPQKIELNRLSLRIGQSDFLFSGELKDYLSYLFKKGTLQADLKLHSEFVNLNQLIMLEARTTGSSAPAVKSNDDSAEEKITAFTIPDRLNLNFLTDIGNAVLGRIPIRNISGSIKTAGQKLHVQNLEMKLLGGELRMNGSYQNTAENQPIFDYGFGLSNIDIPTMAKTLGSFRKMLPGAERSTGRVDASLNLKGRFDQQLKLIPASANGKGTFSSRNLMIAESPVFRQLEGIIKKEKLKEIEVEDFTADLIINAGNMELPPFDTKIMGQAATIGGNMNAENILDFRLDFMVDREAFGPDIEKILAVIPGNEKIKELPAAVNISGPSENPKVQPDLAKTTKAVAEITKDDLKKSLKSIFDIFK